MRNALTAGLSLGLVALVSGSALAQDTTTITTTADTEVPPNVQPAPPPPPPVEATVTTSTTTTVSTGTGGSKSVDSAIDGRPSKLAIGIGVGYTFPTDLSTPNTTSVRLRLPSGLTFEPTLTFGIASESQDPADTTDSETTIELGTLVRLPLLSNAKFDLEGLGGIGFGTTRTNPEGDDNNSSVTTLGVNWGLAVNYWLTAHWSVSMSAYTPLLSYTKQSMDVGADDASQSNLAVGLIWDPTVVAMIHLYH